jgi:hypothetical protein
MGGMAPQQQQGGIDMSGFAAAQGMPQPGMMPNGGGGMPQQMGGMPPQQW